MECLKFVRCDWCASSRSTAVRWLYDFFGEPQLSICEACDAQHRAASRGDGEGVVEVGGEGSAQMGGAGASAGLGTREADGRSKNAVDEVVPLGGAECVVVDGGGDPGVELGEGDAVGDVLVEVVGGVRAGVPVVLGGGVVGEVGTGVLAQHGLVASAVAGAGAAGEDVGEPGAAAEGVDQAGFAEEGGEFGEGVVVAGWGQVAVVGPDSGCECNQEDSAGVDAAAWGEAEQVDDQAVGGRGVGEAVDDGDELADGGSAVGARVGGGPVGWDRPVAGGAGVAGELVGEGVHGGLRGSVGTEAMVRNRVPGLVPDLVPNLGFSAQSGSRFAFGFPIRFPIWFPTAVVG